MRTEVRWAMLRISLIPAALLFVFRAGAQEPRLLRIATAPAESLHVSVWGTGEPVVIVPGIWSSTFAFRKVIPRLRENGFQVIVIEPLGVASSGRPQTADYSTTAQSRRIGAVLDSLRVGDAMFIGQALSTAMLLRLAVLSPERVRGIVSLEGGAVETSSSPGLRMAFTVAAVIFRVLPSDRLMRRRLRSDLENVSGDRTWITKDVVDGYMATWSKRISETLRVYRAMAGSKEPERLGPRLGELRAPLQLIVGAAPHYGAVEAVEIAHLEKLHPRFGVTRIPGAGHLLHEERPEEVVAALLSVRRRVASGL